MKYGSSLCRFATDSMMMGGDKYKSMMGGGVGVVGMGCGRGWGGGVCCLLEVPEGCSCQVNALQCTLEGIETDVGK